MNTPLDEVEPRPAVPATPLGDDELVRRIRGGEYALFEIVMRRHNQQLYRAARAIMKGDAEVEDILQAAYLNAFSHLDQFESRARLSTWLTRIVIHEAYARRRQQQRQESLASRVADEGPAAPVGSRVFGGPEHQAYASELNRVIEGAVDELPETYRLVFMLRDVEGMSTAEAGEVLGLGDEAVKTRLHRARAMLRRAVATRIGASAADTFQFDAPRCDRVVAYVIHQLPIG
jgi:RNA polymerase sigma-70 factor (ECF subfamily)